MRVTGTDSWGAEVVLGTPRAGSSPTIAALLLHSASRVTQPLIQYFLYGGPIHLTGSELDWISGFKPVKFVLCKTSVTSDF